jgi:hypothetical protein
LCPSTRGQRPEVENGERAEKEKGWSARVAIMAGLQRKRRKEKRRRRKEEFGRNSFEF